MFAYHPIIWLGFSLRPAWLLICPVLWAVGANSVQGQETRLVSLHGPVHEALLPGSGLAVEVTLPVPRRPPDEIPLLAPPPTPAPDAQWIEGYWQWHRQSSEFVWVPGIWRRIPDGLKWQTGNWAPAPDGAVRYPGYWYAAAQPPEVVRAAPPDDPDYLKDRARQATSSMVGQEAFWVRGSWELDSERQYKWKNGYLAVLEPAYQWQPGRVVPVSGGYVVLAGYWDYPLPERGSVFAALRQPITADTKWTPVDIQSIARSPHGDWIYTRLAIPPQVIGPTQQLAELRVGPPTMPRLLGRGLVKDGLATIAGKVRKGKLTPQYIRITLSGGVALVTESDDQGQFSFENVPYGVYSLFAEGPVQNYMRYGVAVVEVEQPMVPVEIELD